MLGTVDDGVKKNFLTASRAKWMTAQRKCDGVRSRASRVILVTAWNEITHDGVRCRFRQSKNFIDGVRILLLTPSPHKIYIYFSIFHSLREELVRIILRPNLINPRSFVTVFSRVFTP